MESHQAILPEMQPPTPAPALSYPVGLRQHAGADSWLRRVSSRLPRRSLTQASVIIAAQGFSSAASFFLSAILARACSKGDYGLYVQFIALLNIVSGIQMSFTGFPYTILHPHYNPQQQRSYLGSVLALHFGILLLVGLLFLLAGAGLSVAGAAPLIVRTTYIVSLAGCVFLLRDFATVMILARLKIWPNFAMVAGGSVATVTGLVFCYMTGRLSIPVAFMTFAVCTGIPVVAAVYLSLWKDSSIRERCLLKDTRENWRLGKWLAAKTLAHMGATSIFPFLLASLHDSQQTALYGVCLSYANLLNPLVTGVTSFFRPRAAYSYAQDPRRLTRLTLTCTAALSVLLIVFLALTAGWGNTIIGIMFGSSYRGLQLMLVLSVVANSIWILSTPISIAIEVRQRTDATFRGRLAGCIVSLATGTIFVWLWGPIGAMAALALANVSTGAWWLTVFLLPDRSMRRSNDE